MQDMSDTSSTFEKTSQSPLAWGGDIQLAVVFLTRIPWRLNGDVPPQALNRALRAFPLIGLIVGGGSATVFGLAHFANLPALACALLAILSAVLLTGALHEDGLADVADGFGGGQDKARKLEIMRDSRLGAYGGLALVFSIGLRTSALIGFEDWTLGAAALVGTACLSRVAPALLIYMMDPARSDGLAATMEKPAGLIICQSLGLGVALFLLCTPGMAGWITLSVCTLALLIWKAIAQNQIGGQTGDVCGASQQIIEISALLTLASLL